MHVHLLMMQMHLALCIEATRLVMMDNCDASSAAFVHSSSACASSVCITRCIFTRHEVLGHCLNHSSSSWVTSSACRAHVECRWSGEVVVQACPDSIRGVNAEQLDSEGRGGSRGVNEQLVHGDICRDETELVRTGHRPQHRAARVRDTRIDREDGTKRTRARS